MASTFAVTRNHLIFGLCLPLAVLMGYLLAEPFANTTWTIFGVIFAILIVPIMMRWYHPLLILSWHMAVQPAFLPGSPKLWAVMALLSLFFAILNRAVDADFRFIHVPMLVWPMVALGIVTVATAMATGGIGLRIFGGGGMGGKGYFYILAAIAGYFALVSRRIKPNRAAFYIALFFLPGLTALVPRLARAIGPPAHFLFAFFPLDADLGEFVAGPVFEAGSERVGGLVAASLCLFCWLLARYGVAGSFNFARPWRIVALTGVVFLGALGGFRSILFLMGGAFTILFFVEKLWRTRVVLILAALVAISAALLVGFADKLPITIQRSLSFLPVEIDPLTRQSATDSTEWRLAMWKMALPLVPKYLLLGKGFTISADDIFMVQESEVRGYAASWEESAMAGDYHNGPLSVIIPLGIWGMAAFVWLGVAGVRFLYTTHRNSLPELRQINAFLFALFLARILFFLFLFGALYSELFYFTGILGLSVALNGSNRKPSSENVETTQPNESL